MFEEVTTIVNFAIGQYLNFTVHEPDLQLVLSTYQPSRLNLKCRMSICKQFLKNRFFKFRNRLPELVEWHHWLQQSMSADKNVQTTTIHKMKKLYLVAQVHTDSKSKPASAACINNIIFHKK